MIKIIVTIFLVSAFFILFFNPSFELQNKMEPEASTTAGFIEDTDDAFYYSDVSNSVGLRWIARVKLLLYMEILGHLFHTQAYLRITGCMVFPIKKPKRNTAKAIIQVDLSTFSNKSNLSL